MFCNAVAAQLAAISVPAILATVIATAVILATTRIEVDSCSCKTSRMLSGCPMLEGANHVACGGGGGLCRPYY